MRPIFAFFAMTFLAPLGWLALTVSGIDSGTASTIAGGVALSSVAFTLVALSRADHRLQRARQNAMGGAARATSLSVVEAALPAIRSVAPHQDLQQAA